MRLHIYGLIAVFAAACSNSSTVTGPVAHPGVSLTPIALGNGPWNVAISRQGLVYVTQVNTDSVASVNLDSDRVAAAFKVGNGPYDVSFNAAGSVAYVTNLNSNTVGVINTSTRTQTASFPVASRPVRVALGPAETKLYVTLDNGELVVLDAASGHVDTTIGIGGAPLNGLALTSDRSRLYVSGVDGIVSELNTATNAVTRSFLPGGVPQDIVVGSRDTILYVANESGWVELWSLTSWTRTDSIPVPAAFGLALTPDAQELWVAETQQGEVGVIDCVSHAMLETIPVLGTPRHLAITPNGTTAVVANEQGAIQIIR